MRKYNEIQLDYNLRIGVCYNYTPMGISMDRDIPNDPPEIYVVDIDMINGSLFELIEFGEGEGGLISYIESYLKDLNE